MRFLSLLLLITCMSAASAPGAYAIDLTPPSADLIETPPFVLQASSVLGPQDLHQEGMFAVQERVLSDGFLNEYVLVNEYGESSIRGGALLGYRLHELRQLQELKNTSTAYVLLDASGKAGVEVITAPAVAVGSLFSALINPTRTWKTLKKVPSGVVGLFEYAGDQTAKAFNSAGEAIAGESQEKKDKARERLGNQASNESEKYALRWAGYSSAEKHWYAKLGVDPYTEVDPLRAEIARVARAESAVNIAFKFVPGVGGLAFVGDANKVLKYSGQVAAFSEPSELRKKNRGALKTAGFNADPTSAFLENAVFSPTLQTALAQSVIPLVAIAGANDVLRLAANVKSREAAVLLIESANYLSILHRVKPIAEIMEDFGALVVVLNDRTAVMVLPADTVFYTPIFAETWRRLLSEARSRNVTSIELRLRGAASPALRAALDKGGIFLFEKLTI